MILTQDAEKERVLEKLHRIQDYVESTTEEYGTGAGVSEYAPSFQKVQKHARGGIRLQFCGATLRM